MGYRSDVRIVMKKENFKEFIEKAKEILKSLTDNKNILEYNIIDNIDICKDIDTEYYKNQVYFGWDDIKWHEDYAEIQAINQVLDEFAKNEKGYVFSRYGEDYGDFEEIDNSINYDLYYPQIIRYFDDDNLK